MHVRRPALWLISAGIALLLTALACWLLHGLVLMGFEDSGGGLADTAAFEAWLTGHPGMAPDPSAEPAARFATGLVGALMLPTGLYRALTHR